MTEQHPITPPQDLIDKWESEWHHQRGQDTYEEFMAKQSAQWGADQELEACIEWVSIQLNCTDQEHLVPHLRTARRPKQPSLKEQAQIELDRLIALIRTEGAMAMSEPIRRALEALPND